MKHHEGDLVAAALFTAASNMFSFMLAGIKIALENERKAGFTEDGRQLEPTLAHIIRPALEKFMIDHSSVGEEVELSEEQATIANSAYRDHLASLREQILEATKPFEI